MSERINTSVRPWRGEPAKCPRLRPRYEDRNSLEACKRPVEFKVWDSALCARHTWERLAELLCASLRAAGVVPVRDGDQVAAGAEGAA